MTEERPSLRRALNLPTLAIYGIGGMLGGGIYALVGEVAGDAGNLAWLAFLVAMLVAAPTGLSYAELCVRHPRSGGEANFARAAFGGETLPLLAGWLVLFSGLVSMAALARAFSGYVLDVADAPRWLVIVAFMFGLGAINVRGIRFASAANIICTAVEAFGLVVVVVVGARWLFGDAAPVATDTGAEPIASTTIGVLTGAALAFYAYIGFEDMVNVAEEVREPKRVYPFAIPIALGVVGLLYALVSASATAVMPPAELLASSAPLSAVVRTATGGFPEWAFTIVALFAIANTVLLNFVTTSRLLFGMSRDRLLPHGLSRVHRNWRTPWVAILTLLVLVVTLAVSGGVRLLAGTTSFLLLGVFFLMNLSLARLHRGSEAVIDGFQAPRWTPYTGMVLSATLAAFVPLESVLAALGAAALGLALIGLRRILIARADA